VANKVTIASLYPLAVRMDRPLFVPHSNYQIPACPKGDPPNLLAIEDQSQFETIPLQGRRVPTTIPAINVAEDAIRTWTESAQFMADDAKPAIFICRDKAGNLLDTPTKGQIAHYLEAQDRFMLKHLQEADRLFRDKKIAAIPKPTFVFAEYMNYQAEWRHRTTSQDNVECPYCTKVIAASAIICPHCSQVVNIPEWAKREAEKAAALASLGSAHATPIPPPLNPNAPKQSASR
jgi:hypothetical protein